jgi:hypothetical protein
MRKIALFVLLAAAIPSLAAAQVNVKSPFKASFCWDGKDDAGATVTGTVQVLVKIDGTSQTLVALPAPSGSTGCPTGSSLYTTGAVYSASKATHSATGAGVTVDGAGIDSDPFAFAVVGRPPSKFSNFQIVQ